MNSDITQQEVDTLLSGNGVGYQFYEPTAEDMQKQVRFYDSALSSLCDAMFYLRCLAMMHRDFLEYSYTSPNKGSILTGIAESVEDTTCKLSAGKKTVRPLSSYNMRIDSIKWSLLEIQSDGLFEQHKKYLPFVRDAYLKIVNSVEEV